MQDEDELKDFLGEPEEGTEPETKTGSSTSGNEITRRLSKREVPASKFYPSGDVGSQKSCGSCSMWSSLHVLNGFLGIANGGKAVPLSEKWLIDCWDRGDVKYDCHGVWDYWVYDWLKSHTPVVKNAYAPYTLPVEECATPTNGTFLTSYARKTYDKVTDDALVEMLQNGPLVASLKVEKPFFSYSQGILEMGESCTSVGGHAVAVVGYGSEDGVDFFILKNSWGYSWGDKGYFRVRRLGGGTTKEQRYCDWGWLATQPILSGAMPAGFDANFEYTTEQELPAFLDTPTTRERPCATE